MPTFEMDEHGNTVQVKSIFDSTPAEDTVDVEYLPDGGEIIHESEAGTTRAYREWISGTVHPTTSNSEVRGPWDYV